MSEQSNIQVVRDMFAALGRRDVAGVLDRLSDDIEWKIAGPSELPYAGTHRGRDEVAKFFQTFGQAAEFEVFEPQEYFASGDKVVVLGHERQRIRRRVRPSRRNGPWRSSCVTARSPGSTITWTPTPSPRPIAAPRTIPPWHGYPWKDLPRVRARRTRLAGTIRRAGAASALTIDHDTIHPCPSKPTI